MTHEHKPTVTTDEDAALAPPPDDLNPALIDLHKTFIVTLGLAALFIGCVIVFILF